MKMIWIFDYCGVWKGENMKEAFSKIVDKLEEEKKEYSELVTVHFRQRNGRLAYVYKEKELAINDAIEIVNQVAEEYGNDGWIPISSGNLPDENTKVWCINADGETMAGCVRLDDDEQDFIAWGGHAYYDWLPQVVAWMPIVPYKEGE